MVNAPASSPGRELIQPHDEQDGPHDKERQAEEAAADQERPELVLGDRVDRLLSAANCALLVLFVLWRPVWESVLEGTGEGWWVYAIGAGTTATLWYCLGR